MGLYKTELIRRRGPWRNLEQVELATAEWMDWWNQRRLHGAIDNLPPAEHERRWWEQAEAPVARRDLSSSSCTSAETARG